MENNLGYRWETKEEQEKHWKVGDDCIIKTYNQTQDSYKMLGSELYSEKDCGLTLTACCLAMTSYILHNKLEWAENEARLGLDIIEKVIDKVDADMKYPLVDYKVKLYFFLDKHLYDKYFKEYIVLMNKDMETLSVRQFRKHYYVDAVLDNIKYGDFEKAREYTKELYEIKAKSRLNKNVIYHLDRFCVYVAEYLCDKEKNADMLPKLTSCFKYLFDEEQKGSKKLYSEKVLEAYKKDWVRAFRYIWYKYFSGRDWDTISPVEVIQSERYGVKGLQDYNGI